MNNKGFMMAEVIVVSAIVLVTLTGMYTSYSKIFTLYNQRLNYYDVSTLYELAYIRDNKLEEEYYNNNNNIIDVPDLDPGTNIYYVKKNDVKNKNISTTYLNVTFQEYLEYLSTSINFDDMESIDNLLVMEKCDSDGKSNCKYAYLEVLND